MSREIENREIYSSYHFGIGASAQIFQKCSKSIGIWGKKLK